MPYQYQSLGRKKGRSEGLHVSKKRKKVNLFIFLEPKTLPYTQITSCFTHPHWPFSKVLQLRTLAQGNHVHRCKNTAPGSSRCCSAVKNLTSIHEEAGLIPGLSGLRIQHCCELQRWLQMWLGSMAPVT